MSKIKTTLLFIVATIWIEYNYIPILPIGFLVILLLLRPRTLKRFSPFVIAMVLGLIGTGISLQFFKSLTINPHTKAEHHLSKFLWGFNVGTKNLTRFLNRNIIKLYQDDIYTQQQKILERHLQKVIQHYNMGEKGMETAFKKLWEEYGEVEDMYHFGNLNTFVPDIFKNDVLFVYKIKFAKSSEEQTIHLRTLFDKGRVEIVKVEVKDVDTEYNIRNRFVQITNYREIER